MSLHERAGHPAQASDLINIPRLVSNYYVLEPTIKSMVNFGTSGHRGSSNKGEFTEVHVAAICQAISDIRREAKLTGPLFLGMDTHALSECAFITAIEVLVANNINVIVQEGRGYTPTPVISHAIIQHNNEHPDQLADGIVITPSHNPPQDGGIKYNASHGGPADAETTKDIQQRANHYIQINGKGINVLPFTEAWQSPCVKAYDYIKPYVDDLKNVINVEAIAKAGIKIGVDPLGGSGLAYWSAIAENYGLDIEVVNKQLDPTFSFMTLDKDGEIRMDCSSPYAMAGLVALKDKFDVAVANDPDYDRHGIVTRSTGLMNPNHYLSVVIDYLFKHREHWPDSLAVGKTLVSSSMIDRVASSLNRQLAEVPVGFKWFVDGLKNATLGIAVEESAGASFLKKDGTVWSTDKDGIILALLAAEITAVSGKDPGVYYQALTEKFSNPIYTRIDTSATLKQKQALANLNSDNVIATTLAGEVILEKLSEAPANQVSIDGLKVVTENGWFAARPSGTENIYKIYAESFLSQDHLNNILEEAKRIVTESISE